ncbi:tyrosine--tRNA ligase [Glycocaulis sp.]|uniref:tyrosine--tRNA ligase n=1 Tax=Glycocaulis sp. TaxID=1969725 RepID=UPI0025B9E41A|nr:tyrosine--tRNA ligase [Glycocaulis sp.]MCC5995735.1 tyrosine--tRNA ligase [Oceanicaulis sp.]MCH8521167.1 tyrosine--tRNA ligase [Glycocaulis sp.]
MAASTHTSDLVRTLVERGYLYQATDMEGLDKAASAGAISGYIGFDLTATSLHVGSLVQIMMLRRLQQAGHTPIILMGGATTKVGDPTGRDSSRPMLTPEIIAKNLEGILKPFHALLDMDRAILVNNDDWLGGYGYLDFLRDYGTHFTINRMLSFDSVKLRLDREQPMTFLEFNYMLLQAVDFLELNRRHGTMLQMGGADQWGNIINGVELCRRVDGKEVYGFTTPLITSASGAKMGKTADGAVWLNADMKSAYEYWQFWRNTEDADVGRFLKLFTDLPLDEIARLEALQGAEINTAKVALANAATAMLHGDKAAQDAEATARETFAGGGAGAGLPTITADLTGGIALLDALVEAELCGSKGEAKRKLGEGAVKVNDGSESDAARMLAMADLKDGAVKLSVGKKRHALVKPG